VSVDEANSLRIGDLADREGVSAPTATRLVASLEELNLISRAADPADRRTAYVALTGEGRSKLDWARSAASADLADRLASLSPTEVGRLAELIPLLESLVAND
jgi:DNA-binding MarR family transcriptional regulator